ncbi:hypothetical protein ACHWQZ_G016447 [Mnemiopsis leidyi]
MSCCKAALYESGDVMTEVDEELAKSFLEKMIEDFENGKDEFKNDPIGWLREKLCSPDHLFGGKEVKSWLKEKIELEEGKTVKLNAESVNNKKTLVYCHEDAEELMYVLLVSGIIKVFKQYEKKDRNRRRKNYEYEPSVEKCFVCVDCVSYSKCCRNPDTIGIDLSKLPCHPIWILNALVTEEHLEKLEKDPLRISLKLRALIRQDFNENTPYMYSDMCSQRVREVPRTFAESLINECVSPAETELLMNINDETILFDLQVGKFGSIVQRPAYKKLYQERIFWQATVYESFKWSILSSLRRFFMLIFWNMVYPLLELLKLIPYFKCTLKRASCSWLDQRQLFSPISCFTADMVNYVIMIIVISLCMLQKQPNQDSTIKIAQQFLEGNISVVDHPRLKAGNTEGVVLVQLEKKETTFTSWTLLACLLSRLLTEFYQLCNKRIWSALPEDLWNIRTFNKFMKKLCLYWSSDMNKIDILLMGFLVTALGIELHYTYFSHFVYGTMCVKEEGCGDNLDYKLESRRIIYMTNCYSVALLLSLVRLFYCAFLFVPIIGPILLSIQKMVKDVFKVLVILIFFSVGFFVPLFAIIKCYIYVNEASNSIFLAVQQSQSESAPDDNADTFAAMKSATDGFLTMIFSIMEGKLTYSEDVYKSRDPSTTIFFSFIMFFYFLIFGLLCVNLLIALISKRYETMTENKDRDWRFSQFDFLVDYININVTHDDSVEKDTYKYKINDGMPFFFPFNIVYIPVRLVCQTLPSKMGRSARQRLDSCAADTEEGKKLTADQSNAVDDPVQNRRKELIKRILERRKARKIRDQREIIDIISLSERRVALKKKEEEKQREPEEIKGQEKI